jgi:hypothetical protein
MEYIKVAIRFSKLVVPKNYNSNWENIREFRDTLLEIGFDQTVP